MHCSNLKIVCLNTLSGRMPSRLDVRLVGRALVSKFHTCMLRLSQISRFCKAKDNGVLYPL
jgi:hypothetical protein